MHTGLSEEQRRQIEKMRRQSGRMPVYRKTAEKVNDFSEKTEELPQMVAPDKKTLKKSVKSMFFMVQTRCEVETIKY